MKYKMSAVKLRVGPTLRIMRLETMQKNEVFYLQKKKKIIEKRSEEHTSELQSP